ncbi:hypothetical protein JQV19_18665 [Sulfitobacter mediterraneus]|uniref:hypothetical protein n=1 Tax=Sulfitobacter mediterraneus TaxID=83219 RepID=UPI0019392CC1|nr:hypothetical protein [Sulfitobacter mediterraneus]MBM1558654.1 hypothetical protein [Sulfitobacter mediterraneus]MBM1570018.1 hypothetical protein [Sulfitobacter mediterraneus]MBM1573975.1 hypothetical protein [Sulfitobacter mediterraneus]MBM1577959.1 hypothetical protein [Sulfitobacter mediterraneus]MBM1581643.1 hypothetical protein [Sulfitobacter mediterraneus]
MSHVIIQSGLLLGFFSTWIGFACFFFSVAKPNFSIRKIIENNTLPLSDRMERAYDDLVQGGKSRIGRLGQLLIAIGLTVFIITGVIWLTLQIVG